MKTIGKVLCVLSFIIFAFGIFSFKMDLSNEQKEASKAETDHYNDEFVPLDSEQIHQIYKNNYILDGLIIGFGAVSLVVGGLLLRKSEK